MAIELDELQIDIQVNADEAASSLKTLASELKRTASTAKTAAKDLSDTANGARDLGTGTAEARRDTERLNDSIKGTGNSSKNAGKNLRTVSKNVKEAGNAANGASGKFHNLMKSIGRIAMYRAIRSSIKLVTSAISEGFNMFATWDKEMNGGLAGVAGNVAAVTEKWTILKGQIGAAAGALFNSFAPVITFILDGLTKIIDVFQMVIRSLQGEYTYYHLIYKEAEATTGAAKELKRVLFGFDDLNVLPSASGGGAAVKNGGWAYESRNIDSKFLNGIADFSNKVREALGLSDDWQNAIGGLLGVGALGGLGILIGKLIGLFKGKNTQLGEQTQKTQADANAATALATSLGFVLSGSQALQTWWSKNRVQVGVDVENPVPKAQSAYNAASSTLGRKITIPTLVQSAVSAAKTVYDNATSVLSKKVSIPTTVTNATTIATQVWTDAKSKLNKVISIPTTVQSPVSQAQAAHTAATNTLSKKITIPTLVQSAVTAAKTVYNNALSVLNKNISIPTTINSIGAGTGLVTTMYSLQSLVNTNPLAIAVSVATAGLATKFASFLNTFQSYLSKHPLSIGVKVAGAGTVNPQATTYSGATLEGWNVSSSKNWSATDYVNYAESTGLNLTSQDRAVGAVTAGAILAAPLTALFGAIGGAGATSFSLSQLLSLIGVGAYASGGTPDVGTLFWAGEHGAEVVTSAPSGKTGVTNVEQMQDAIASGNENVVAALYEILRAVQNKDTNVYLDGAKVGQSVRNYQNNQSRRGIMQGV